MARLLALKPSFLLWRYATLCALVFGALSSCLLAPQGPTKRALLIGIDDYAATTVADLRGCVNDVELMKTVLVGKFEIPTANILMLKNEQATRSGILNAIRDHLIRPARSGDIAHNAWPSTIALDREYAGSTPVPAPDMNGSSSGSGRIGRL